MKIDKRIILYLDSQMTIEERKMFEDELSRSSELSQQLEFYKNILESLKIDEQKFVNEDYFVNLLPKFKEKLVKDKKPFKIKTAYALTAVAVFSAVVLLIFNLFNTSEDNSLDGIISNINENEAVQVYNYYSANSWSLDFEKLNGSSDSLFTELLASEFNLQESDAYHLVLADDIQMENIYSEIQIDEAELIYNEILNTKYF